MKKKGIKLILSFSFLLIISLGCLEQPEIMDKPENNTKSVENLSLKYPNFTSTTIVSSFEKSVKKSEQKVVLVDPTVLRFRAGVFLSNKTAVNKIRFKLFKPDGTEINSSNYNYFPNVSYTEEDFLISYIVDRPEIGEWIEELEFLSDKPNGVSIMPPVLGTPLIIETETSSYLYFLEDEVDIRTSVIAMSQIYVSDLSVTGKISTPDGKVLDAEFYDDGQNGDYKAEDSLYTYVLKNTTSSGFYYVIVTAKGKINGIHPFKREESLGFEIAD